MTSRTRKTPSDEGEVILTFKAPASLEKRLAVILKGKSRSALLRLLVEKFMAEEAYHARTLVGLPNGHPCRPRAKRVLLAPPRRPASITAKED